MDGWCQEAASSGAEALASLRELDTPELTPLVEWWPLALEMQEKPDWVDCSDVIEPR